MINVGMAAVEETSTTENLGGKASVLRITKEEPALGDLTAISAIRIADIYDCSTHVDFAKFVPAGEWTSRDINTSENTLHIIERDDSGYAESACGLAGEYTDCLLNADNSEENYFLLFAEMDNGITDQQREEQTQKWIDWALKLKNDINARMPNPQGLKWTNEPTMLWSSCDCVSFGNMKLCQQCMDIFVSEVLEK